MDPYIGQIMMFAGTFAPPNWAMCDGQALNIGDYAPLFSLIGTTYGGDGKETFCLPDLRGRAPAHVGASPGVSRVPLGETAGFAAGSDHGCLGVNFLIALNGIYPNRS